MGFTQRKGEGGKQNGKFRIQNFYSLINHSPKVGSQINVKCKTGNVKCLPDR